MNSKQISRQSMFVRVDFFLIVNSAIVTTLPNYSQHYAEFVAGINTIKILSQEQMFDKSGFITTKKRLKLALAQQAFDVSKKMQAFATFTGQDVLLSEIRFTESELKYASDEELIKYAQGIHNRAQANIADLANYDITSETLTTLLSTLNSFEASIPNASIDKAARKENTAQIAAVIKTTEKALEKIDVTIEIIRLKEPQFYNEYKNLRKPVETGTGSLALKGIVTDAETKQPVKNANIVLTIKENGSLVSAGNNGKIVKTSATKGGFYIKLMPNGIYNVEVSKNGYSKQKATIAVTNGELTRLNIELAKSVE
ncbi:MAG: carboxypeptidase-like regulatory domain-containing protein [Bacteroidales bacterium]|nr:carboxypeptidase-like regulatory domain-containing protein [Bacteroidales bacterium]